MRVVLKAFVLVSVLVLMTSDMAFSQHGPQTLYLKNGQTIACDHFWMEGDTLLVVPQGKRYGISYEKKEIDLQRSSVRIQDNVKIQESSGTATEKVPRKGQRSLHTVYHKHYSIAREPSRPGLNEKNSNVDALPPSINKGSRQQPAYKSTGSRAPRSNYPGSSSGKHLVRKPSVPQTYQASQEAQRKKQQEYQHKLEEYNRQKQQIEEYNKQVDKYNAKIKKHERIERQREYVKRSNKASESYNNRNKSISRDSGINPMLEESFSNQMYREEDRLHGRPGGINPILNESFSEQMYRRQGMPPRQGRD